MQIKVYGKRGVHKDTKLQERGGQIFERDGILYNCAFSLCDMGREIKSEHETDRANGKTKADIAREFEDFCKSVREHLSVAQMREILEMNDQDSSGSDGSVTTKWLVDSKY